MDIRRYRNLSDSPPDPGATGNVALPCPEFPSAEKRPSLHIIYCARSFLKPARPIADFRWRTTDRPLGAAHSWDGNRPAGRSCQRWLKLFWVYDIYLNWDSS